MAVRGLTRFARPSGSSLTPFAVCPAGCASSQNPVGVLIPADVQYVKKPVLAYELFSKYGGEGLTRFARLRAAHSLRSRFCPAGCASSRAPVGFLFPADVQYVKKPVLAYELFLKYGGEGIRTPIRCRIHTFRACSFSHSDTSPYCCS